jgi:hypothetical protein
MTTGRSIGKTGKSTAFLKGTSSIWHVAARKLPTGIEARKEGFGTETFPLDFLRLPVPAFGKNALFNALTPSLRRAKNAAARFLRQQVVQSSVLRRAPVERVVETGESARVYDLKVADAHCFYANGFLVHNCDSMTLALMRFRQGGFIALAGEEEPEGKEFRRKKEYY